MTATWIGGGKTNLFRPKPSAPKITWRNPITRGLVFDACYFQSGGLGNIERVAQKQISTFSATTPSVGPIGAARTFPGGAATAIDTYTSAAPVNGLSQFTIETFFRLTGAGGANLGRLIYKGVNGTRRWNITVDDIANVIILFVGAATANGEFDGPTASIVPGQWVQCIWTYDYNNPSVANLYQNGVLQTLSGSAAPSGTINTDSSLLTLGNSPDLARCFGGDLSHVRIWNRMLSQAEITKLWKDPFQIYARPRRRIVYKPAGGTVYNVAQAETGTAADTASAQLSTKDTIAETGTAADSPSSTATLPSAMAESGAAADSPASTAILPAAIGEIGAAADTITGGLLVTGSISEAGAAIDTEAATVSVVAAVAETGTAADSPSSKATLPSTMTESGAAADTPASTAILPAAIAETGAGADTTSSKATLPGAIAEAGAAVDTEANTAILVAGIVEVGAAIDTDTSVAPGTVIIAESGSLQDTVSAQLVAVSGITESGTAADTPSAKVSIQTAVAEAGAAADTVSALVRFLAAMVEAGLAVDQTGALAVLNVRIQESGDAQDAVTVTNLELNATPCNILAGAVRVRLLIGGRSRLIGGQRRSRLLIGGCCE